MSHTSPGLKKIIQDFSQHPSTDAPCVISAVTAILKRNGHTDPEHWESDPDVVAVKGCDYRMQYVAVCDYWRLAIGALPQDTQLQRYALQVSEAPPQDYLTVFDKVVAPFIVKHKL